MVNTTKTKPIPIKPQNNLSTASTTVAVTAAALTGSKFSPFASPSPSNSSPQTTTSSSLSSNESPAITIQASVRPLSNPFANYRATPSFAGTATVSIVSSVAAPATNGHTSSCSRSTPTASGSSLSLARPSTAAGGAGGATSVVDVVAPAAAVAVSSHHYHISSDILDDLASRFIINVPDDERNNLIRICFQIELAHWFYLDFFCAGDEKKCGMKQFAMSLFHHIPFLRVHLATIDKILESWRQYKLTVPTYGAILLSEDLNYVLLVQSYWAKSSWGFPKGKVNENEDPIHCATREVFEETGYDITNLIVKTDYIESVINDQYTRLYLVRNVPLKTLFMPRTRKEIKCCEWFLLDSLPINKNDSNTKQSLGINANSFFMIMPFIKRLKKWAVDKRSATNSGGDTVTQHLNRFKFNGPAAVSSSSSTNNIANTSIHNINISNLASNTKKMETKMPFKTVQTVAKLSGDGTSAGGPPITINQQSQSFTGFSQTNSRSWSSRRQRHKSVGDLDGMMTTKNNHQSSSCFQNNLRQLGATKQHTTSQQQSSTNNVFNDLTATTTTSAKNATSSERVSDKNVKQQNIARSKYTFNGSFGKAVDSHHQFSSTSSSSAASAVAVAPANVSLNKLKNCGVQSPYPLVALVHNDCKNENNNNSIDPVKQQPKPLQYHPPTKSPKITNTSASSIDVMLRQDTKTELPQSQPINVNKGPIVKNQRKNETKLSNNKPNQLLKVTTATTSAASSGDNVKKSISFTTCGNFESWKEFTFTSSCIANVFFK